MGDTKGMEVIDGGCNLMGYLPGSLFGDFEVLGLEIVEEVTTFEVLHDDVNVVRILKHIVESDDVWMLAHFQHFNLSFEQFEILEGELFLFDNFDSNFFQ